MPVNVLCIIHHSFPCIDSYRSQQETAPLPPDSNNPQAFEPPRCWCPTTTERRRSPVLIDQAGGFLPGTSTTAPQTSPSTTIYSTESFKYYTNSSTCEGRSKVHTYCAASIEAPNPPEGSYDPHTLRRISAPYPPRFSRPEAHSGRRQESGVLWIGIQS